MGEWRVAVDRHFELGRDATEEKKELIICSFQILFEFLGYIKV